ncbi:NYN domain-containing protein [Pectinatus haikarae]|uniref:RNA-binding protein with PIN domain n=1 Tax=Pectinatus haikarae TaxID=349096 RepID=A0ABT9Y715_9FIRM|nr:NYN domain-containing protein [Pectinatus haikarae]MDQ0203443.1 putative RNA-binding protein with PIN domain [Pectinatus haikarae]
MNVKMCAHLIVDGYNVINCWPELLKKSNDLEHARDKLIHMLVEYGAYEKYDVTVVFDALYTSSVQSFEQMNDHFEIVYTKKNETADSYIERLAYELVHEGRDVFVATSDGAEQNAVLGAGAYRMTVKELSKAITGVRKKLRNRCSSSKLTSAARNEIADRIEPAVLKQLDIMRKKHYDR